MRSENIADWLRRHCILLAIMVLMVPSNSLNAAEVTPDQRLRNAHSSFHEMMAAPDKGIPLDLFNKAECIVIIPGVKKAAFIFGGKYGRGFVSCRRGDSRRFGAPAAIRIEGGSYGLQIGGSSTDVFMLIMNETGMNRLLADKFTIGGEAAAAAGPVGRNTSADTDVLLHAEILTWSRSRGIFAGLSLEGSTLRPDGSENQKLYGRDISNREILEGDVSVPPAGRQLIVTLNRYSGTTGEQADVAQGLRNGHVTLHNVHFASGKADLTPDSEATLAEAAQAMKDNPDWKIRVEGFTDSTGNPDSNLKLSEERAESVANWLADHGVDRSRLTTKGYGDDQPVASNKTDAGRRKNRRVDLVRVS
ncbi:MAG TPA: YSC84-related protein [Candidatus Acidoferrales bacterium]|nr:YSC84-related protein [Candidatus Acidoferrales bacterium]